MFGSIMAAVAGPLIDKLIQPFTALATAYINKQITMEELREKMVAAMLQATSEIEVSHAEALTKTYASFMDAMKQSKLMQQAWAAVVVSQLFVLVWSQFFIPLIITLKLVDHWASAGATVDWAYLLLAGCLGMGPVVLRAGPGAGDLTSRLKAMAGK